MNIIVISPKAADESARRLAKELGAEYTNPYQTGRIDFMKYDVVINYGYSSGIHVNRDAVVINKSTQVSACINKSTTLSILRQSKVPVPDFSRVGVKDDWDIVFCHTKIGARKNNGIVHWYRGEENNPIPPAHLYTNHFPHRAEYRVVILKGVIVGRYRKVIDADGMWSLEIRDKRGFENMDIECRRAAVALGIDYVGFDVLAANKNEFVIIEANSAPILTDESVEAFKDYLGV